MQSEFKLSLHTWTIHTTPLDVCLKATAHGGFDAIEIRRSDIVQCYETGMRKPDVIEMIRDSGVPVSVLGTEYGWWFSPPDEQKRLFEVLHETCDIARAVGCDMIMSAPGQVTGTIKNAVEATKIAGDIVGDHGLKLALEFNSQHPLVNRTAVLQEIIADAGRSSCGLLLDAYHLHRSQGIERGLRDVTSDELFAFQYSDVPPVPEPGVRRPVDRLVPGKGVIDWMFLLRRLKDIGYDSFLSYEAPNPILWDRSPYDVCAEGVTLTRALMARATQHMHVTK